MDRNREILSRKSALFISAENLTLHLQYYYKRPFTQLNGGWSDVRDRQLCLSFAFNDAKNLPIIDKDIQ